MPRKFEYMTWITKDIMRRRSRDLFVFGDNLERWGRGGQAAVMRDEPNAVGIPTKRSPTEYLRDDDYAEWLEAIIPSFYTLLHHEGTIVWPKNGIGTGRAKLKQKCLVIWSSVELIRTVLEARGRGMRLELIRGSKK